MQRKIHPPWWKDTNFEEKQRCPEACIEKMKLLQFTVNPATWNISYIPYAQPDASAEERAATYSNAKACLLQDQNAPTPYLKELIILLRLRK